MRIDNLPALQLFFDVPLYLINEEKSIPSFLDTIDNAQADTLFIFGTDSDHYVVNVNNESVFDRMITALSAQPNTTVNSERFAFWYANEHSGSTFEYDLSESNISKVVIFGFDLKTISWSIDFPKYQKKKVENISFLFVDRLVDIESSPNLKKKFWKNMLSLLSH